MKIGVISDVHSNLAALEAVLRELDRRSIERIICLGDVIGYGPQPNECIQLIRSAAEVVLLGNHDAMALTKLKASQVNPYALEAMRWTKNEISKEHLEWLRTLPYLYSEDQFLFVHASPKSPSDWKYIGRLNEVAEAIEYFSEKVCMIGHTHRPFFAGIDRQGALFFDSRTKIRLDDFPKLLINAGSVGQPRDHDPRAAALVIDDNSIELLRVEYDVQKTQKLMKMNGLPDYLSRRLGEGS